MSSPASRPITAEPGRIPQGLQAFAVRAVQAMCTRPDDITEALGRALTEPKPRVWFESGRSLGALDGVCLDEGTRMMYDDRCVYLNGESFRASGTDATLMRQLATDRRLDGTSASRLSRPARRLLADWVDHGWMHPDKAQR